MSSRWAHSAMAAGVVLVIWGLVLAVSGIRRLTSKGRPWRAIRFAKELGIELPPESAGRLEERLRRRTAVMMLLTGPLFALWTGWFFSSEFPAPASGSRPSTVPPQVFAMPVWALGGLAVAAGHVYDLAHSSRTAGSRVARIAEIRLGEAVPSVLMWALRGSAVLPALAALTWLLAPVSVQHGTRAAHPHPLPYLTAALVAPVAVAATEAGQRRILRGRQNAETAQELAFDDALRVETMLAVMVVPMVLCTGAAALIAAPLGKAFEWSGAFPVFAAMTVVLLAFIGFPVAARSPWARRHYLRHFAAYSAPAPPLPPITPTVTAC